MNQSNEQVFLGPPRPAGIWGRRSRRVFGAAEDQNSQKLLGVFKKSEPHIKDELILTTQLFLDVILFFTFSHEIIFSDKIICSHLTSFSH